MIGICLRIVKGLWEDVAPMALSGHRKVECVWYVSIQFLSEKELDNFSFKISVLILLLPQISNFIKEWGRGAGEYKFACPWRSRGSTVHHMAPADVVVSSVCEG